MICEICKGQVDVPRRILDEAILRVKSVGDLLVTCGVGVDSACQIADERIADMGFSRLATDKSYNLYGKGIR